MADAVHKNLESAAAELAELRDFGLLDDVCGWSTFGCPTLMFSCVA